MRIDRLTVENVRMQGPERRDWYRKHSPQHYGKREALPVLPAEVLEIPGDFAARFSVHGPPHRWRWLASTPDSTHPGRLYDACGLLFGHL